MAKKPTSAGKTRKTAPAAPKKIKSLVNAPSKVGADEAIRERIRLYPKAMTSEIVQMMELDGLHVTARQVEQARKASSSKR